MSFIDDSIKNVENAFLKEATGTGAVGGFTGRGGNYIDDKFSGGFHPEFGELRKTLEKQVDGDIMKRMWTDDITPIADQDFIDLEWDYEYTPTLEIDNSKFKSDSETEMQLVDLEINYDKIIDKTEENKKFVNDTNDWKSIYDSNPNVRL